MTELNVVKISLEDYLEMRDAMQKYKDDLIAYKRMFRESMDKQSELLSNIDGLELKIVKLSVESYLSEYPKSNYKHFENGEYKPEYEWMERTIDELIDEYNIEKGCFISQLRLEVEEKENENE